MHYTPEFDGLGAFLFKTLISIISTTMHSMGCKMHSWGIFREDLLSHSCVDLFTAQCNRYGSGASRTPSGPSSSSSALNIFERISEERLCSIRRCQIPARNLHHSLYPARHRPMLRNGSSVTYTPTLSHQPPPRRNRRRSLVYRKQTELLEWSS